MAESEPERPDFPPARSGRLEAFTDAVVAIAMTLLILPLLEAATEVVRQAREHGEAGESPTAGDYLSENGWQLVTFLLSFVLIAVFWALHHRVFRSDTPSSGARTAANFAWMVTIVLMPLTTAMIGLFETDRLLLAVYIGNLAACSWLLLLITALEIRNRRRAGLAAPRRGFLAVFWSQALLYTLALVVAVAAPSIGFYALFLLILTAPVSWLLLRTPVLRAGTRSTP